ncbi:hypothetical protein B296_00023704 [Ensete ventricosum]|uniref:Uncharacterized protein n=1 Tax=Ensete ventricosum TaxID=4639 RepID=A0A426YW53_ENSVE|nr:hypothetical protein B296_00023704 [Ensete ventricosum]
MKLWPQRLTKQDPPIEDKQLPRNIAIDSERLQLHQRSKVTPKTIAQVLDLLVDVLRGQHIPRMLMKNSWASMYQPKEIFPVHGVPEVRQHAFWVAVDKKYCAPSKQLESQDAAAVFTNLAVENAVEVVVQFISLLSDAASEARNLSSYRKPCMSAMGLRDESLIYTILQEC